MRTPCLAYQVTLLVLIAKLRLPKDTLSGELGPAQASADRFNPVGSAAFRAAELGPAGRSDATRQHSGDLSLSVGLLHLAFRSGLHVKRDPEERRKGGSEDVERCPGRGGRAS